LASGSDTSKNILKYLFGHKKSAFMVTYGPCVSNPMLLANYEVIFVRTERLQLEEMSEYVVPNVCIKTVIRVVL
jgi:hypothetical protein